MINYVYKSQFGTHIRNEVMDLIQTNVWIDLKRVEGEINEPKAERKTNPLLKELILAKLLSNIKTWN